MVRPLGMVLGSMRENPDVIPLKSAPFHGGIRTPIQYTVPWAHLSPHPKWHLDQFSRFRRAHVHYRQTNQQKNRPCYSVCSNKLVLRCSLITPPPPQLFTTLFPGPPGWVGARRKLLLDFMVLGRITRGKHTHNTDVRHSIRTNQQSTSISPPIFMPDALPAATLPIYPGLGQAQEYAGLHIPMAWFAA